LPRAATKSQKPRHTRRLQGTQAVAPSPADTGSTSEVPPAAHFGDAPADTGALPAFDPIALAEDASLCGHIIDQLENGNGEKVSAILRWLQPVILQLTISGCSCRVVQKVLEVAGGEVARQQVLVQVELLVAVAVG